MKRILLYFAFTAALNLGAQEINPVSLPRETPTPALTQAFSNYLDDMKAKQVDVHSIMVIKDGKVMLEKWMDGYSPDAVHIMNSASKTFTAMAVGFAINEGKLHLNDRVADFFPEYLPANVSENAKAVTVKDLLIMESGHKTDPMMTLVTSMEGKSMEEMQHSLSHAQAWETVFFFHPFEYKPGTEFCYDNMASYMLSSLVQKVTGEKIVDYLVPRLWRPLGIPKPHWDENGQGVNAGAYGLYLRTEDLAKMGLCLLDGGKFQGKQVIPASWVKEATSYQGPSYGELIGALFGLKKETSDQMQGYGYQLWMSLHNSYRIDGAGGQFALVIPEKNAVVVTTGNTATQQEGLDLIWNNLYDDLGEGSALESTLSTMGFAEDPMKYVVPLPDGIQSENYVYSVIGKDTLTLNYYRAVGDTRKRPTVIFSFGGGWAGGEKEVYKWVGRFVKHGLNAACIDYSLLLKGQTMRDSTLFGLQFNYAISAAVADLYDATRFLLEKQDDLGVDPERIILNGGSAGATNSIMAEYWICNEAPLATSRLPKGFNYAAVIPCAGGVWKQGLEMPQWKKKPCPHMFVHGSMDWVVPFWYQPIAASNFSASGPSILMDIFKRNGYPYESFIIENADHTIAAAPLFGFNGTMVDYTEHMFDFIDRVVLGKEKLQIDYWEKDYDAPRSLMDVLAKMAAAAEGKIDATSLQTAGGREYTLPPFGTGKMVKESFKAKGISVEMTRDASFEGPRPVLIWNGDALSSPELLLNKGYILLNANTGKAGLQKIASYVAANAGKLQADASRIVLGGNYALEASAKTKCAGAISCGEAVKWLGKTRGPVLYFGTAQSDASIWSKKEEAKDSFILYTVSGNKAEVGNRVQIVSAFIERCVENREVFSARINEKAL